MRWRFTWPAILPNCQIWSFASTYLVLNLPHTTLLDWMNQIEHLRRLLSLTECCACCAMSSCSDVTCFQVLLVQIPACSVLLGHTRLAQVCCGWSCIAHAYLDLARDLGRGWSICLCMKSSHSWAAQHWQESQDNLESECCMNVFYRAQINLALHLLSSNKMYRLIEQCTKGNTSLHSTASLMKIHMSMLAKWCPTIARMLYSHAVHYIYYRPMKCIGS